MRFITNHGRIDLQFPPKRQRLCDFRPGEIDQGARLVRTVDAVALGEGAANAHLVGFDTRAEQTMLLKKGAIATVCSRSNAIHRVRAVEEYVPIPEPKASTRVSAGVALAWTWGTV